MDADLEKRLLALEAKIDAVFESSEKIRKYFLVLVWVTVLMFVLPMVGLVFALPSFIDTYTQTLDGLM